MAEFPLYYRVEISMIQRRETILYAFNFCFNFRPKVGRIKANTDHMTERMEYSVNQGKTWRLVPDTWPIASYNPILLRTRSEAPTFTFDFKNRNDIKENYNSYCLFCLSFDNFTFPRRIIAQSIHLRHHIV